MATVQNVNEQQGSNWVIPTAVGGAVGAGAGYFMAPAKYSSLDQLVAEQKDIFGSGEDKIAEPTDTALKDKFNQVKNAVVEEKNRMKDIDKLFEGDKKPPRTLDVLKGLDVNLTEITETDAEKISKQVKIAQEVAQLAEGDINFDKVPEELKKMAHTGEGSATAEEVANLLGEYGATNKVATSEQKAAVTEAQTAVNTAQEALTKATDENRTQLQQNLEQAQRTLAEKEAAAKEGFSFKLVNDKLKLAQNRSSASNVKIAEFLNKQGDVTADELKGIAKKDIAEDVKKAFEENKKIFGKNKWFGLAVGAAGGLLVGWLASKFFGGSKEA